MMFNPYCSNVEFNSTSLSVVPGPMLSSNRHVILQCFMLVFLNYCHLMAAFELGKLIWNRLLEFAIKFEKKKLITII